MRDANDSDLRHADCQRPTRGARWAPTARNTNPPPPNDGLTRATQETKKNVEARETKVTSWSQNGNDDIGSCECEGVAATLNNRHRYARGKKKPDDVRPFCESWTSVTARRSRPLPADGSQDSRSRKTPQRRTDRKPRHCGRRASQQRSTSPVRSRTWGTCSTPPTQRSC